MIKKPELLAPAGSIESLYVAINNGCDAVYVGGKQFSARHNAGNFSNDELKIASEYCHVRGIKLLVAINTVYKQKEVDNIINFSNDLYKMGVDGVIVQDVGVASLLHTNFPDLNLNASTQMTAHSLDDVKHLEIMGFKRVILSRELSLEEIKYIVKNTNVEIECFIHGALCVCYSGQCLLSSMLGGRSGNRGRCAQPCRLKYSMCKDEENENIFKGYLLSPKDTCAIEVIPELIDIGVSSLKIEGRMKRPEYVAGVVSIYRKYIDLYCENHSEFVMEKPDRKILEQLFNRGGFTQGYFNQYSGKDMMSIESPKNWGVYLGKVDDITSSGRCIIKTVEDLVPGDGIEIWTNAEPHPGTNISKMSTKGEKIAVYIKDEAIKKGDLVYKTNDKFLMDKLKKTFEKNTKQMNIYGKFIANIGKAMILKVWNNDNISIENRGMIVEKAKNQPMNIDKLRQQIEKTGNTPFKFADLELILDNDIYISISCLNEFRRETLQKFEKAILDRYNKKSPKIIPIPKKENIKKSRFDKKLTVLVKSYEQLNVLFDFQNVTRIYFEIKEDIINNIDKVINMCEDYGIELFAVMPRIWRQDTQTRMKEYIDILLSKNIYGYLVRTWGQFYELNNMKKNIALDYTFNIFNYLSIDYCNSLNIDTITLSPELNYDELNSIGSENCETIGYGYLPLMVTNQCPVGNYIADKSNKKFCSKKNSKNRYFLKDRLEMMFQIYTDCEECISYILNSQPIFLLESMDEIIKLPTGSLRLQFMSETPDEVRGIVYSYEQRIKNYKSQDDTICNIIKTFKEKGYTKGHYFRGIE